MNETRAPVRPKTERQVRDQSVRVMLTLDEKDEITAEAESLGLETSSWARMVLIERARRIAA